MRIGLTADEVLRIETVVCAAHHAVFRVAPGMPVRVLYDWVVTDHHACHLDVALTPEAGALLMPAFVIKPFEDESEVRRG